MCLKIKVFFTPLFDSMTSRFRRKGPKIPRLSSYLSDRYQRVLINNSSSNTTTFSGWGKIKHGVPEGSILGPLFFLIYINDLPNIIADPSKPILFADDMYNNY
jgi:hypothetical protein